MQRRDFLTASTAASALALTGQMSGQTPSAGAREFYLLRTYHLQTGPQTALCEKFIADALIPTVNRMGMNPIGAFKIDIGPETPTFLVLIPSKSVEALTTLDLTLSKDEAFLKLADPFWSAPATAPSFLRTESKLLSAFEGWPKLTPPPSAAQHQKRLFQLRTYESPSDRDHVRKVEMFNKGEFGVFGRAGFDQVFYGDTLVGPRMPNLTYMLSFPDLATMDKNWKAFGADPEWKKLSTDPRYHFEEIVSNITNLILSPLACSQI
ncbi:NIPSNAP family protein [Granulicella arctica]|uniref:NIPSNAP family protein n=1 Tax=Granulicella arctica TaxID=940613 RepID=UPI0021E0A12F|nr:NIPSNAP family protein [Granulicella arctica]